MYRHAGSPWRSTIWGAIALGVSLLALPADAGAAADAFGLNGPGDPQHSRLALGNLSVTSAGSCAVSYEVQVQTETGGGSDEFEIQLFDDGALIQVEPLSAPADGGVHAFSGTLSLQNPVSQGNPGIGVYLVDSGVILDFVDPANVVCGVVEIPTLDALGAWILGGLLLASAFVLLRRRRAF